MLVECRAAWRRAAAARGAMQHGGAALSAGGSQEHSRDGMEWFGVGGPRGGRIVGSWLGLEDLEGLFQPKWFYGTEGL